MTARYFKETPCEVCGGKPWESVFAFRSPSLAHTRPVGEPGTFPVEPCPGSGGVRQEVTINYEAALAIAPSLYFKEVTAIVDAALIVEPVDR